jgi:hypothetical protein
VLRSTAIKAPQAGRGRWIELSVLHCNPPHPSRRPLAVCRGVRSAMMETFDLAGWEWWWLGDNTRAEEGLYGTTQR